MQPVIMNHVLQHTESEKSSNRPFLRAHASAFAQGTLLGYFH